MNDTTKQFTNRFQRYIARKEKMDSYADKLSNLRFLFFLAAASLIVLAFIYAGKVYGYAILSISVLLFIILIVKHDRAINEANRYHKMAEINQKCLQRVNGDWTGFSDDGHEYANPHHGYINDLDIFGPASLFQWINTAHTYHGRKLLEQLLANPDKDIENIKKRQEAIKELSSELDFCQDLQCEAMDSRDFSKSPEKLLSYAENGASLFKWTWLKYIFYLLPFITISSFLVWYFGRLYSLYIPSSFLMIQLLINFLGYRKVNTILSNVYTYKTWIEIYQRLLAVVEKQEFADDYLLGLKSALFNKGESASQQIKHLDKIVGAVAFRFNPLVHVLINNILFWDFHCIFALEKWQKKSGASLRKWLQTIGMFEALSSMALISQLNPQWCYPGFETEQLFVAAEDLGHPLINEKDRVVNSLEIKEQLFIVSGSNMSGKTTLLRTIGINLVLAYAGAPVCAREFSCSIMDIFTSMRISDDLNSGISTFYAELLRIKMIIDNSHKEKPMIFLIDEVFRGTNSQDRLEGARNVLMNLNKPWIIGLTSTHDLALCDLENDKSGRIKNYHFTESYSGNEIIFDYILRPGRCKTTNARYLMKMVGIDLLTH